MNAPAHHRGWYAMIPQLGAPLGLIVASALFAYFAGHLSAEDFFDWGWRYLFFVAFAINVVALFARLRMVATATGLSSPRTNRRPSRAAAAPVVPEPAKRSTTRPPGLEPARMMRSSRRRGFCVG